MVESHNPLLAWTRKLGIPATLAAYLEIELSINPALELGPEYIAELPENFQRQLGALDAE